MLRKRYVMWCATMAVWSLWAVARPGGQTAQQPRPQDDGVLRAGKFLGAVTSSYGRPGPPGTGRPDFADWRLFYTGPAFDGWQPPRAPAR